MKIKDFSPFLDDKGEVTLVERIRGTVKYGASWYADVQAQELIIARLQSALDDAFTLLRNHTLQGLDVPIPMILIGPTGVHVIYGSALKGLYQAAGEQWHTMGSNSRRFRPARPNLVKRSLLLSRAVEHHLERCGVALPQVEPIIVFTDPGIHVDTKRPATRIVMVDALDRFAAGLAQSEGKIKPEDVPRISRMLTNPPPQATKQDGEQTEEDRRLERAFSNRPNIAVGDSAAAEIMVPGLGRVRFSTRQWIFLGVLLAINVVVLMVFIIVALSLA